MGAYGASNVYNVAHGISRWSIIIKADIKCGGYFLPYISVDGSKNVVFTYARCVNADTVDIVVYNTTWSANSVWYITLYYTKP